MEAHPALAYAATLVSVVVRDSDILYVQLGAGDIVTVAETGEVSRPWGTNERLLAKDTTSLCLPDAWQACRVHVQRVSAVDPALIVLSTAGYAHAFREEEGFSREVQSSWSVCVGMVSHGCSTSSQGGWLLPHSTGLVTT